MRRFSSDSGQLWNRLAAAGLVTGKVPPLTDPHSPWFVRVMLGVSGWLGALFLFGFVGVSLHFILTDSTACLIVGAVVCAAAAFIFRAWHGKDFGAQFGLAVSFAGQALFIFGLTKLFRWENSVGYLLIMVFEIVLVAVIGNTIHRVVSALAAAVSLSFALSSYGAPHLARALINAGLVVVWLNELDWADRGSLVRPVGYGLVLASIYVNGALLMHGPFMWLGGVARSSLTFDKPSYWIGILLNSTVLVYAVFRLLAREGLGLEDHRAQAGLVGALVIVLSSFKAPGIITGLIIVLLGYANGNRVLTGIGIFALLAYLSQYYYQLTATLLIKSASLGATGLVLLVAWLVLSRVWPDRSQRGDSHA